MRWGLASEEEQIRAIELPLSARQNPLERLPRYAKPSKYLGTIVAGPNEHPP